MVVEISLWSTITCIPDASRDCWALVAPRQPRPLTSWLPLVYSLNSTFILHCVAMAPPAIDIDNSGKLDAARALQAKLESAKLNIVEDQTRFDTLQSTLAKDPGLIAEGVAGTTDPAIVAAEVASQIVRSDTVRLHMGYLY